QIIIAVYQAADRQILVAYNASKYKQLVSLPEGTWKLRASEGQFFTDEAILETYQEEVELAFLAATIFEQVTK
ncbi:hypothetical protein QP729_15450, partial [Enterococcus faecalis]